MRTPSLKWELQLWPAYARSPQFKNPEPLRLNKLTMVWVDAQAANSCFVAKPFVMSAVFI
jgi:hypothetical protein